MGEVFAGRYELLDLIGEGGMGSVWRVHDRRTDEVVAAKVLRQSDAVSLLRFVRETALRIQHPHVVTPLGWAGEDDRVLFTMPIVDGGSVATLVGDHGPLPAPFVAEILRQLLDALATVHGSGIVHRDVKPANILLRATGSERPFAYLTDFGIAVGLDGPRLTETDAVIGTRGYMAPEQRRGELTPASDLYAVGAVALEMLTAQRPPVDGALEAIRPDDVPDSLWELMSALLAEDPASRPDASGARDALTVTELAWVPGAAGDVEVLRQVFDTEGDDAGLLEPTTSVRGRQDEDEGGASPGPRPQRQPQRRPQPWIAVVIAAVAALVITGVLLVWSPWSGKSPRGDGTGPGTTSSSASTPTSTNESETHSSSPSEPSEPTRTTGSVEVGVVVTRVGQQCAFSDVGMRETTSDGVDVQCQRGDDGSYSWERP